jgi:hypothetical protein
MVAAVRLGVGGALRIPPSTPEAVSALDAAADPEPVWVPDNRLADLAGDPEDEPLAVGWVNRPFWRCQLGEAEMAARLADLAAELEVVPAVVSWPALVVAGRSQEDIHGAWRTVSERGGFQSEGLAMTTCEPLATHCGLAAAAVRALVGLEGGGETRIEGSPRPVYELPSGTHVGWWGPAHPETSPAGGWHAAPTDAIDNGYRWELAMPEGEPITVDDVLYSADVTEPACRLPGWVAQSLRPGRPAALLFERLATVATRLGVPLWIPNIGDASLRLLLGKPGPFWVDGPAAPRADT